MKEKYILILLVIGGFLSCQNHDESQTVICIPVYGQSLALGIDANRITNLDSLANYADGRIVTENMDHQFGYYNLNELKLFIQKIFHYQKHAYELTSYGMAQYLANKTGKDTLICIFPGGSDGTIISHLGKGTKPYKKLLHDIKTAYQSAIDKGLSFEIPALCWMQGETDVNSYPGTNYRELLLQFTKDINNDVKLITKQQKDIEIICYQTNAITRAKQFDHLAYHCVETEVPQTQLELIRDNPMFHASGPTYPYDCVNEVIHIDGLGQKKHGVLVALAALDIIRHQKNKRGLLPVKVQYHDNKIVVNFQVPSPPLVIDTFNVAKVEGFGFSVITPENRNIIKSVSLYDDKIHIICSEKPYKCRIRYGVNGDYMKSGRLHGPRGNLRDSQGDSLSIIIQEKVIPIYNWCYQFDMPIN